MSEKNTKKTDPLLKKEETLQREQPTDKPKIEPKETLPAKEPVVSSEAPVKAEVGKGSVVSTKSILDKAPKIHFMIPFADGEQAGAFDSVQINGDYKLTIQKGVMVEIPVPVANILAEKYRIRMDLGKDKRIDRDSNTEKALS